MTLAPACVVGGEEAPEDVELASGLIGKGQGLFNGGKFGGNDRTCQSCHPSSDDQADQSGTLSPAVVEALFQSDPTNPLFQHDAADVIGGNTFDRVRQHATFLIEKSLPPNVSIAGSDARSVVLARGVPTTMNTPALDPVLMADGREPSLQSQARNAILGHAQGSAGSIKDSDLDAIAAFQQTRFNRDNLRDFVEDGTPLVMPQGTTESEKRGRRFFISDADTDTSMVGAGPEAIVQLCGVCHGGPMLNETTDFFGEAVFPGVPAGTRFFTVLVSELNTMGNPVQTYEFENPDGTITSIPSPDPGLALVTGNPQHANFFKIPTLWGSADTAPYFHDNSAKNLDELMDQYDTFFFLITQQLGGPVIDLTEQDKADIIAYLKLL